MRWTFLLLPLFLCEMAYGQNFSVTGSVTDSTGKALVNASIVVITQVDSSLVGFSTSRSDGYFKVDQLSPGSYILQVSFVGYETLGRDFNVVDQAVDFDVLQLSSQTKVLDQFTVSAERLPFVIRGDTIEYNTLAFMVRPQDMVEDLLRRLPGIDVDRSGTITAQGEVVENVLVEGKEFFGQNTSVATKNLPADAVDQVQVYDKPSDLAQLTGVPDGEEEKTINLELTEEAKQGYLGQVTGGLGSKQENSGRYFGQGTLFRFSPRTQFALIGSGENVSQPGFSSQQLNGFAKIGSSAARDLEAHGYSESVGFGINVSHDLTDLTAVNVNYILTDVGNHSRDTVSRHQLLDISQSAISNAASRQETDELVHEIGFNVELDIGEGHDVALQGNFDKSVSSAVSIGMERLEVATAPQQNSSTTLSDHSSDQLRGAIELIWRKRISDHGQSLIFEASSSTQDFDGLNDLSVDMYSYVPEELISQKNLHQLQEQINTSTLHSQHLQLVHPLRSGQRLTAYLQHSSRRQDNEKLFFDLAGTFPQSIPSLNDGLSEKHTNLTSGIGFGWNAEDRSWFISVDLKAQHYIRKGTTILIPHQTIRSNSTHILPYVLAKKNLGQIGTLDFFYRTRTFEPTTRQLQPFVDNSNSLRIYQGNPALTPEYHHDLNLQYQLYQSYSGLNLNVDTGISYVHNSIIRVRTIDTQLRQHVTEANGKGTWSGDVGLRIGGLISSLGVDWTIRGRMNLDRRPELINGSENTGRIWRNSLGLDLEHYQGNLFEITTHGRVFWNEIKYSLNEELNQDYVTGRVTTRVSGYIRNRWLMNVSFQYQILDRDTFQNSQNIGALNMSISRLFLEGRVNMRLEINDLLNQNQRLVFTHGATYIQKTLTESLGRYFMVKLTYKPKLM
ncbi:MAG: TonB-dependent receptor [Bacteroidota bacterium]|nr:TonB-dependent receptor [Bacteroidota bacterium]